MKILNFICLNYIKNDDKFFAFYFLKKKSIVEIFRFLNPNL